MSLSEFEGAVLAGHSRVLILDERDDETLHRPPFRPCHDPKAAAHQFGRKAIALCNEPEV